MTLYDDPYVIGEAEHVLVSGQDMCWRERRDINNFGGAGGSVVVEHFLLWDGNPDGSMAWINKGWNFSASQWRVWVFGVAEVENYGTLARAKARAQELVERAMEDMTLKALRGLP